MGARRGVLRGALPRNAAFSPPFLTRPHSPAVLRTATCRRTNERLGLPRWSVVNACAEHGEHTESDIVAEVTPAPRYRVMLLATATAKTGEELSTTESAGRGGLFGMQARAYWKSMGFLPLFFAGVGIAALGIKLIKVMQGKLKSGKNGVNRAMTPESVITSPEMEQELHVYKCGGCGYEIYPARGREFKFFPDSFKCPLCETPKSEFWDLNDPDDARNQVEEDEDDGDLQPAAVPDLGGPGEGAEDSPTSDTSKTPKADASEPSK